MKRISLIFIFIIFVSASLFGQARKIEFTEYDLDNGLHVILHKDNSTPIVAVTMTYHVGSKNEDPERTGFAHFFEHLMFEGSKYIEHGEFDKINMSAGGINNASTNHDFTHYYMVFPSNQLKLGLWMESERMLHLKIDTIGVETQRKVVKEERSERFDNQPYGSILEETFKRAYQIHPYKWLPAGSAQYIDQATIDEFMTFYKKFYVPNNACLSIAGDIDIEQIKKWIHDYFADIPKGEKIKQPDITEPPLEAEIRDTVYDNIQLPLILQAYRIPEQGSEDYYALQMLSSVLAAGQSSRLYKELVDKQQKAVSTGSFLFGLEDPGLFIAYGISNLGVEPDELESLIQIELDKVKNNLIDENEFQKLQNQIENSFVSGNSTMTGIAESLATYYLQFGETELINTDVNNYLKVTREDIKNAAEKYLNKNNRVVLVYLPKQ